MNDVSHPNSKLTETVAQATGRRWCSHHGGEVPTDQGSMVVKRTSKRWVCFSCQSKAINR